MSTTADAASVKSRSRRVLAAATAIVCATALFAVYTYRLNEVPAYVGGDEAYFAVNAYAISTTGRDLNGHAWPLLVNIVDPLVPDLRSHIWYQPILVYLIAAALKIAPLSVLTIRGVVAAVAVLNVLLMYFVAKLLFRNRAWALAASIGLAATPAGFMFARQAVDYICPLPFVLSWLYCLLRARTDPGARWFLAAGVCLGVGVFSYVASWAMMPLYLAMTLWFIAHTAAGWRRAWVAVAGFSAPLAAAALWMWSHGDVLADLFSRYHRNAIGLLARLDVYWQYFDPAYLFFTGSAHPAQSTRTAGVFPFAFAIFLVAGLIVICRRRCAPIEAVVVAGFLSAPFAVVTVMPADPFSTGRELYVLPFGVLLAIAGLQTMAGSGNRWVRAGAVALVLTIPVQFRAFLDDYFGGYRTTSATRFDSSNVAGVADFVIDADARVVVPAVYLSQQLDDGGIRWRFHLLVAGRGDLWTRTHSLAVGQRLDRVAPGSLVVVYPNGPDATALDADPSWRRDATIREAAGADVTLIYRKVAVS